MTLERPPDVDDRLREAFRGDEAAAARVARGAFARAAKPMRRLWWWRYAVLPAAGMVLLGIYLVQARPGPPKLAEPPALSGTLADGMLVVDLPDGSVSITDAGIRDERPPDGFGIVFVEGAPR
jgi:hypothetical protein